LLLLLLFLLFDLKMGAIPGGSGTTIRHNTQIHISHNITHHAQKNTAHKTTQTMKDSLHTMNTTQKSKDIPVNAMETYRVGDIEDPTNYNSMV
jgi:hypothetical protein